MQSSTSYSFKDISSLLRSAILKSLIYFDIEFKGVVWKFWNFFYYWSDLTEIFTQYVKSEKKHLFMKIYPLVFYIYTNIYNYIYIYLKKNRTPSVFMLELKQRQFWNPWKISNKMYKKCFPFFCFFLFEILDGWLNSFSYPPKILNQ